MSPRIREFDEPNHAHYEETHFVLNKFGDGIARSLTKSGDLSEPK
ncbi:MULTISPECIES: hypothetical protein [Bacillus]|nr:MULTISPECIES: hypothetical protein [Bacillus]MDR4916718.1 hypothetical protein [Bacillus pseudomycoides]